MMGNWEIRKDGEVKCHGSTMDTYPDKDVVAALQGCGYKVYVDGELQTKKRGGTKC